MSTHQSLQRAVAILRVFSEREPALTVTEVSHRVDIHKSTVSRILTTLLEEGMVRHDTRTGRYSLGMGVVEMAGVALGQIDVRGAAMPHIEALAKRVDETVSVTIRLRNEALTVAHQPGPRSVRHVAWIGRRIPLASTAAGKALLAAMHARAEDWAGAAGITEDHRAGLVAELERIAGKGFAEEADEFEVGTSAVAVPIPDRTGAAAAALAISGPTERFDHEARVKAVPALADAAAAIAGDLGLRRNEASAA